MIDEMSSALKDKGLALVRVDVSGTDFKKSLKSKEIGLDKDIERELATLGRKSVFGNEFPKKLRNNKDQTYTHLDKMGVRFGTFGTWAVPVNLYKEVIDFLEEKKQEREQIKAELLRQYDMELQKFAEKAESMRPGFGKVVLDNAYHKDHIRGQIQFHIEAQTDILSGVGLSAVHGLSRMATDYEQKIMRKAKESNTRPVITRFTRSKLEEMRDYCYRFVFLTGVLNRAADLIEDAIDCLPATVVKGQDYPTETSTVMTALKLLRTPDELDGIATSHDLSNTSTTTATQTDDDDEWLDDDADETTTDTDDEVGNHVPPQATQIEDGDDVELDDADDVIEDVDAEITQTAEILAFDHNVDDVYDDDEYWDDSFDDEPTETNSREALMSLCV